MTTPFFREEAYRRFRASPCQPPPLPKPVSALLALVALGAGGAGNAAEIEPEARALLREATAAAQDGNFESAWGSLRQTFLITRASEDVDERETRRASPIDPAYDYCDLADGCPTPWRLAWLLGKPRAALEYLDGRCADFDDDECARWMTDLRAGKLLLAGAARPPATPQAVALLRDEDEPSPQAFFQTAGLALRATVDTGRADMLLHRDWANLLGLDYETIGDSEPHCVDPATFHSCRRMREDPRLVAQSDGVKRSNLLRPVLRRKAILRDFAWGALTEDRVPATIVDGGDAAMRLGMDLLLRYGAACFSWAEGALYLGALGPCRNGERPFSASLEATSGAPLAWGRVGEGEPFALLVDTRAGKTRCAAGLVGRPVRFGVHPALRARCAAVDERIGEDRLPPLPMAIGMDVLERFAAFGWALNPFRLYFVPIAR